MRLLSRYVLRQLAAPFFFALTALTGMLLLNQVARRFPELVGKGLPVGVVLEVFTLSIPFIVALTLPMAVLVAVLYGISHLAADNEITAMRANGVSVLQLLAPVLVAGAVAATVNFLTIDQVLPRSNAQLRNLVADIGRKKPTFQLEEQVINSLPPTNYYLRASRVEQYTGRLRDVTIFDMSLPYGRRVIYADSGTVAQADNGRDIEMQLYTGNVHEYRSGEEGVIRSTAFETNTVRVKDVMNQLQLGETQLERGDREMTTCEMLDRRTLAEGWAVRANLLREQYARKDLRAVLRLVPEPEVEYPEPQGTVHCGAWRAVERWVGNLLFPGVVEAQETREAPAPVSFTPSPDTGRIAPAILTGITPSSTERERAQSELRSVNTFGVEIHKKFTISMACMNFVLIGIALALRFPRGGMGLVLGGGLTIFAVFYIFLTGGETLADRNILSPAVAMWAPNLLLAVVGVVGLIVVSRETGSTRGGDMADLRDVLFGWIPFRRRRPA